MVLRTTSGCSDPVRICYWSKKSKFKVTGSSSAFLTHLKYRRLVDIIYYPSALHTLDFQQYLPWNSWAWFGKASLAASWHWPLSTYTGLPCPFETGSLTIITLMYCTPYSVSRPRSLWTSCVHRYMYKRCNSAQLECSLELQVLSGIIWQHST